MNRSYNHIKHFIDSIEVLKSNKHRSARYHRDTRPHDPKHHANQLDDKQRRTGFDYYEYDMLKFGTPR